MESDVEFTKISRAKKLIALAEREHIIEFFNELEPLPDRICVNPFNGEKMVIADEGKAQYKKINQQAPRALKKVRI